MDYILSVELRETFYAYVSCFTEHIDWNSKLLNHDAQSVLDILALCKDGQILLSQLFQIPQTSAESSSHNELVNIVATCLGDTLENQFLNLAAALDEANSQVEAGLLAPIFMEGKENLTGPAEAAPFIPAVTEDKIGEFQITAAENSSSSDFEDFFGVLQVSPFSKCQTRHQAQASQRLLKISSYAWKSAYSRGLVYGHSKL